ncbi:complement component C6 [Echeneis naucrates]|uniref:complement component C6 n=1 Tax=Echeneis naucrates TaxID=173247 RepID=UPI001113E5DC|nr:complement component C6 [Echeneis naucrates]
MVSSGQLVLVLQLFNCISGGLACFCEKYTWSSWSGCTVSCNHGTQRRERHFVHDDYYWKSSCQQLCNRYEWRSCNSQTCPINCVLTEYGPWSDCSACDKKQFRTRSVQRPSQFGGSKCSPELAEERPCIPTKECQLPPVNCGDKFKCDIGRCISQALRCNNQDDCGDNSDERGCINPSVVCPVERRPAPGSDLAGNGVNALSGEQRGAVLDNTFMGEACIIKRPKDTNLYHRVPYNFQNFDIQVGDVQDFSTRPEDLHTESITVNTPRSSSSVKTSGNVFFPIFYFSSSSSRESQSYRDAFDSSKKMDSKFFRVHQVLPVSTFRTKEPGDLVLSLVFLQFLHDLPLDYNYAQYREIFQRFGTHYYSSGKLGGHYDLLYQYNRAELKSSGLTEKESSSCLHDETFFTVILYTESSSVHRCRNTKITEKYQGSFIQASEKSFSMVRGGRPTEAVALSWQRGGPVPDRTVFRDWKLSVLDNPDVVDYKLQSIIDLVRGIPCAITKRRHLRRAFIQYLEEFDTCKCAPCPNNAMPILSGTECKCVCQSGTYGKNCEVRAPDYTADHVDGYWSCWGPWSSCGASMKRHRTRRCDNPSPLRGGKVCDGPVRQDDPCHISIFEQKESCENDDDFTMGWKDELPPGVEGCLRPQRPANSFLRKAKQYYSFGEDEEFECFTGFQLEGFQYINCLPGGTWSQPSGSCIKKRCLAPEIPDGMLLSPEKNEYKVGDLLSLKCEDTSLKPQPESVFTCSDSLGWEPPLPTDLHCTNEETFVPDPQCGPGEKRQGSQCACIPRGDCGVHQENVCVLNTNVGAKVQMSLCSFLAGRCHGDPLFFISEEGCRTDDDWQQEWAKFRAEFSSKSSVQVSCGLDTCFEWESCSASKKCQCKTAQSCQRGKGQLFCVKTVRNQRILTLDLCSLAALKCARYDLEIINEGACASR